jgi:hypothetical protein
MSPREFVERHTGRRPEDGVNEAKATTFDWIATQAKKWVALGSVLVCAGSALSSYVTSQISAHDQAVQLRQQTVQMEQFRTQLAEGAVWRRQQGARMDQLVYFFCATSNIHPQPPFCREIMQKVQDQADGEATP